ncbi:MAG: hypothetical protein WC953_13025 [Pseudomonas sp.]
MNDSLPRIAVAPEDLAARSRALEQGALLQLLERAWAGEPPTA